ncbi:hypothetical protein HMPREF3217_00870 [Finegoldia magna]|nr:hypothetical protein HMPREF3217_00870 [Finegoldia magna]
MKSEQFFPYDILSKRITTSYHKPTITKTNTNTKEEKSSFFVQKIYAIGG